MAIDASIYNALLMRPKSSTEYANEYAAMDDQRQARQMNALQMQDMQATLQDKARTRQEREALAAFMGQGGDLSKPEVQQGLYRAAPTLATGVLKDVGATQKEFLQGRKAEADTQKAKADTEASQFKLHKEKLDYAWQAVGSATSPETAKAAIMDGMNRGYFDLATASREIQAIPQEPNGFSQWRQGKMTSILGAKDQLDQIWKSREFNLKADNELVGADGKINGQVLGAKQSVARSGASNVSINTGQKGLDNEFKLRGEFKSEPIYKAHQEMQSAYGQIKEALSKANPVGDLAGATKIMKLLDPGSVVRESELGMAMAATGALDRLQNYAGMVVQGTKLTPKQRTEFQGLADSLYGTSVQQYNAKRGEYEKLGGEYGLNAPRALGPGVSDPSKPSSPNKVVDFGSLK